jgi:alkylation response protein AidB-like acyl-CoA dehydrogenase
MISSGATCRSSQRGGSAHLRWSEAGAGSDAFSLTTRAVEDGDDDLLSGRKLWI